MCSLEGSPKQPLFGKQLFVWHKSVFQILLLLLGFHINKAIKDIHNLQEDKSNYYNYIPGCN